MIARSSSRGSASSSLTWHAIVIGMAIYVFCSLRDDGVLGFTESETGARLPAYRGPWERMSGGAAIPGFVDPRVMDPILAAIEADRYFVADDGPIARTTEH